jgi:adenylate kinase family enzyme
VRTKLNKPTGAPGSGKGTLGRKLSDDYNLYHLSVGDYMREVSRDTLSDEREIIQDYLQQAKLLPSAIILPLLRGKIEEEQKRGHENFLIDGFPREISQALDFEKLVNISFLSCYQVSDSNMESCSLGLRFLSSSSNARERQQNIAS